MASGSARMDTLATIDTPAAVLDVATLDRNIARMQLRMNALGVKLRPHVKTSKSSRVVAAQLAAGARGITVSTLREAEHFFDDGVTDILYAVGIAPRRLPQVLTLRRRGCNLKIIVDNAASADAVCAFAQANDEVFEVWLEIDSDGHRAGIRPDEDRLIEIGRALHENGMRLGGVMTHAGASYALDEPQALAAMAEQERAACVGAAMRLREAGLPCAVVSVGSTPTALSARHLHGVTEVRAGVYAFQDLVMLNVGVCDVGEIALSVLTTVTSHQVERGWAIVDAGWMAMSRDRGTQGQKHDYGYGQVCAIDGTPIEGCTMVGANQEHGILAFADGVEKPADIVARFPVGTRLRILPNHACSTATQFGAYQALSDEGVVSPWSRIHGW